MATVSINDDIYKTISKIAKKENTTEDKIINDVLKKEINNKTRNTIPDYLIGNKDTYDPDPERRLRFGGFITGCKPFNAVELVREMRRGD